MKNRIALVTAFCCISLALPAFAEEGAAQGLTPAAQAKVKEELKGLAQAFGIETPKPTVPATTQPAAPPETKTAAQVADKALDMVKDLVTSVSKTLESVAPQVWRIMIRQQYAKAIADLVLPWALFAMVIIYWAILSKKWVIPEKDGSYRYSDERVGRAFAVTVAPIIGGVGFFCWGAYALANSIKYLVNPEYYAVRDLLIMLLNPSGVQ